VRPTRRASVDQPCPTQTAARSSPNNIVPRRPSRERPIPNRPKRSKPRAAARRSCWQRRCVVDTRAGAWRYVESGRGWSRFTPASRRMNAQEVGTHRLKDDRQDSRRSAVSATLRRPGCQRVDRPPGEPNASWGRKDAGPPILRAESPPSDLVAGKYGTLNGLSGNGFQAPIPTRTERSHPPSSRRPA
jgi:hypothetical protein